MQYTCLNTLEIFVFTYVDVFTCRCLSSTIRLTKTIAVQNEVALSYYTVRGLYFLAVVFVSSIEILVYSYRCFKYEYGIDFILSVRAPERNIIICHHISEYIIYHIQRR